MRDAVDHQVRKWLEQVVIGLNLCPFAGTPYRNGQIRITVSQATTEELLLAELQRELLLLNETPADTMETTLLVVENLLSDFDVYNQFLDDVDLLLLRGGWEGAFQVASFHPQYKFLGTEEDDAGNLTNRSPWPILHIIREASIDKALSDYPESESIPERNIQKMKSLSLEEKRKYFS